MEMMDARILLQTFAILGASYQEAREKRIKQMPNYCPNCNKLIDISEQWFNDDGSVLENFKCECGRSVNVHLYSTLPIDVTEDNLMLYPLSFKTQKIILIRGKVLRR